MEGDHARSSSQHQFAPQQWPGERVVTRYDVRDANESPASRFLDQFESALLLSECDVGMAGHQSAPHIRRKSVLQTVRDLYRIVDEGVMV